ncbi:unnamed protein product [Symbiodinium pilosum]|uniref:Uncharacterized protein n=1 Tax=Symbiodinium pilosum TaxID=2952 RepID=A0A812R7G9_SYMPI|nr:unnamed protein product [Symbiodinium pilosum]
MLWQTNFMLQRLATPGEKVQLDAPPMPQEWGPTIKSFAHDPAIQPTVFIGGRLQGRSITSPYNWPTTNATPVHERKASFAHEGSRVWGCGNLMLPVSVWHLHDNCRPSLNPDNLPSNKIPNPDYQKTFSTTQGVGLNPSFKFFVTLNHYVLSFKPLKNLFRAPKPTPWFLYTLMFLEGP